MCIFICAFISILNGAIKLLYDLASGQISIEFHNQSVCSCIYGKVGGGVVLFQIFVSLKWLLILFGRHARICVKGWEQEPFLSSDRDEDLLFHSRAPHILNILSWRKVGKKNKKHSRNIKFSLSFTLLPEAGLKTWEVHSPHAEEKTILLPGWRVIGKNPNKQDLQSLPQFAPLPLHSLFHHISTQLATLNQIQHKNVQG